MKKYIFIVLLIGMAAFAQAQTNRWKPIYTKEQQHILTLERQVEMGSGQSL